MGLGRQANAAAHSKMTPIIASLAFFALAMAAASPADAIDPDDYRNVGVDARVPLDLTVTDESGRARHLREMITRPAVLVLADYTCTVLCGPIVAFVGSALARSEEPER